MGNILRYGVLLGVMIGLLGLFTPGRSWATPINSPNARALFGGFSLIVPEFRVTRATDLLQDGDEIDDPLDRELTVYQERLIGVHALTRDLSLALSLPIVQKRLKFTAPDGRRATIRSSGTGDLSLVGVYRLYRRDVPRGSTQVSFIGGLKFPTGSSTKTDPDVPALTDGTSTRIPRDLQPGTGSVDGIVGVGGFQNVDRLSFYGSLQGKLNTEADDFKFGNRLHYDFTTEYVLFKERNLLLNLEMNGVYEARAKEGGRKVANSGGHQIFISPGIQYLPIPQLVLQGSVQLPVLRDLNGTQLGTDFSVVVGLMYLF